MKRFNGKLLPALILAVAAVLSCLSGIKKVASTPGLSSALSDLPTIVVDAGHGGIDPGAVGADGTLEKGINLSISQKIESMLKSFGFHVIMTRTEDSLICDDGLSTVKEKKRSDITKRLAISENSQNSLLLSIHQNNFGQTQYYGTQVFYSPNNSESKKIAEVIQSGVITMLQKENTRQVKPVGSEIYLLYHSQKPAVMVECGFMSNTSELARLKMDEYQNKMAFSIVCSIVEYCSQQ